MNFKKLEKATKIYEQIKLIDAQIIEIDRFALLVANGEIKSSFELKIEDIGKKKEDAGRVGFDEDGSLVKKGLQNTLGLDSYFMPVSWLSRFSNPEQECSKNDHLLKHELGINATMQILGVLLCEKKAMRQSLLSNLESLGIQTC